MYQLWVLGALDNVGDLTPLGRKMSDYPMEPSLAKMLLVSVDYGCASEVLTIVSMLSVPSVFYRPRERQEESDAAREKFFVPESDHLTLLHVYTQWKSNKCVPDSTVSHTLCGTDCRFPFFFRLLQLPGRLGHEALPPPQAAQEGPRGSRTAGGHPQEPEARHSVGRYRLGRRPVSFDHPLLVHASLASRLTSDHIGLPLARKSITAGYFHQAARVKGIGEYMNCRTAAPCILHPTSALYGLGFMPDYVIYHELVMTSKQYMMCVTSVDPYWLGKSSPFSSSALSASED